MLHTIDFIGVVFSACAEVVPKAWHGDAALVRILRVRGGSSTLVSVGNASFLYSPRARR